MSIAQLDNTPRCQHVRLSGQQCKAPARRGTQWCLFHAAEHNEAPLPFSQLDDAAGIHAAVGQVLFDLQRECIDYRRAALLFSGLRLMRSNLKQLAAELGDEPSAPSGVQSRQDKLDAHLESMPSFAEILIERVNEFLADTARENGDPAPAPMSYEEFQSSGNELGAYLLKHLRVAEDPPEVRESQSAAPATCTA